MILVWNEFHSHSAFSVSISPRTKTIIYQRMRQLRLVNISLETGQAHCNGKRTSRGPRSVGTRRKKKKRSFGKVGINRGIFEREVDLQ